MYNKKGNSHFDFENKLIKIPKSKCSTSQSEFKDKFIHILNSNRSQSAIEFVILVGVVIFFFTIFFIVLNESMSEKTIQKQKMNVEDVAIAVQNEINLASESSEGYSRQFKIPDNINGRDYQINITEGLVYLKTSDNKNAMALPVRVVTGQLVKGSNTIKKNESGIFLNL